ncbi:hypothetical protein CYY_002031 [Polysphondylium violaceum]|uniref:Ankyrin repeat-containing protein n=1 Tax=Polysphondylium violaceum TaxID=133409 RepID=A0A8J4Q8E3_9MYCE|nr:hypothetical protein CYY_002031 [Polysphondylium violaceum]
MNSTVDQLFRFTFSQIVIRRHIFRWVAKLNNPRNINTRSQKYEQINDLKWVIENRHFGLLRDKLKRNEYLYCYPQYLKIIMHIRDLELFKQCFSKYKLYFPLNGWYPQTIKMAVDANNYIVMRYLIQCGFKPCSRSFEQAVKLRNADMVCFLAPLVENLIITDELIDQAIDSCKIEIVERVLELAKNCTVKPKLKLPMDRIRRALSTGKVEILKIFEKETPFDYDDLDSTYFVAASSSLEMFVYLYERYGECLKTKKDAWSFYLITDRVSYECARRGDVDIIKYIYENKLVDSGQLLSRSLSILRFGQIEVFKWIREHFLPANIGPIEKTYICDVRGSLMSLENVRYLYDLGLSISSNCLLQAIRLQPEVFIFLYNHANCSSFNSYSPEMFVYECVKYDNAEVLLYLKQHGSKVVIRPDAWDKSGSNDKCLDVFKLIFQDDPPLESDVGKISTSMNKAAIGGALKVFKYLYEIKKQWPQQSVSEDYQFYESAAMYGHLNILEYLHEQKAPFIGSSAMVSAAQTNRLDLIEYLFEQGHKCTSVVLETAAFYGHLSIIKYFASKIPDFQQLCTDHVLFNAIRESRALVVNYLLTNKQLNQFNHSFEMLSELGNCNITIVEMFHKYKWLKKPDYTQTLSQSMRNGYIEVVQFLTEKLHYDITIDMVQLAISRKNSWILEYLIEILDMHPIRDILKPQKNEKNSNDPFVLYMEDYLTRCFQVKSMFPFSFFGNNNKKSVK